LNAFMTYQFYIIYFENEKIITWLQILEEENGKCRYQFEPSDHMVKGIWLTLDEDHIDFIAMVVVMIYRIIYII